MTKTEQQRAHVLTRVQAGILTAQAATELLGLSLRHLRRLLAAVRQQGLAALAHGNRGRASTRRLSDTVRARVRTLARTTYAGANDHHLTELLRERDALRLSRPTVRRLLREAGIGSPRTRRSPRHRRRQRMPQAGLLVQLDGSQHPWLEDRGPRLVLHAAVDDATGKVLGGVFRLEEDTQRYFLLLRQLICHYGVPMSAYTDRHGIFHRDPRTPLTLDEQLQGTVESTQVGRALQELGIRWIPARSPQAKGRIERLFGTFQDRLVVELRLAHASTMAQAQRVLDRFLPRYNARFAHAPAHPAPAWRPAPPDLEWICCCKYQRIVAKDNTVTLGSRHLQILPGPHGRSYAGLRVDVYAQLNGPLAVSCRGQRLVSKLLPPGQPPLHRPKARCSERKPGPDTPLPTPGAQSTRKGHIPPADHPWRWGAAATARRMQLQIQGSDIFTNPLR